MTYKHNLNQSFSANLNFLSDLDIDLNVKDKLSNLILKTINGNNEIYETPIAKEGKAQRLFSEFNEVFDANKSNLNSVLTDLELQNKSKFGPRSIAIQWVERSESLTDSFEIGNYIGYSGIEGSKANSILRPLSLDNASKQLKNDTNSGLPYYTKKGIVKQRVLDNFDVLLKRKDPCVLFTRTQEQSKTRNVWGFPMADTLNEMRYYSPLLQHQKKLSYRAALVSPEEVSRRMTEIVLKAVQRGYMLVSIDFAKYDNTVKSQAQKLAFNYIKSLFQPNCLPELEYIEDRFQNIGIVTPIGVLKGSHGVPSGSTFTNEVDSIVQSIIATSLTFISEQDYQVQGDDGVYLIPKDKYNLLIDKFKSCGLVVKEDKSYSSNEYAVYLQCLYHIDYINNGLIGGIYPIYRALNRICYQERWSNFEDYGINGKDYYAIRTICIVENCKYHPLFRELIKLVIKYDKYSLSVSDEGIAAYVQMIRRTKGAGEILNHQYGDNVSGIRSFESFKLINELG